jgi:hypothetical protein
VLKLGSQKHSSEKQRHESSDKSYLGAFVATVSTKYYPTSVIPSSFSSFTISLDYRASISTFVCSAILPGGSRHGNVSSSAEYVFTRSYLDSNRYDHPKLCFSTCLYLQYQTAALSGRPTLLTSHPPVDSGQVCRKLTDFRCWNW